MKIVAFFLSIMVPVFCFGQANLESTVEADDRLIEVHGIEYINTLKTANPFLIKRWNFYLDNAYFITDEVPDKVAEYKTVEIEDLNNINILKLEKEQKLERAWAIPTIYKIENTEKLLIYYSGKEFNKKLRTYLSQ